MRESQLVESSRSSVTGSASVSENTATISEWRGTTTSSTTTTRTETKTAKRIGHHHFHQRRGKTIKTSSSSSPSNASIPSSLMEGMEEAVPGAVPIPGYNILPSDGHTELEDGSNYHGVQDDRPLSSLVVASELVEEEEKIPAENLEERIHQVVETQLLMHHQNIVLAESILTFQGASHQDQRTKVDDNRGFFTRNWKWLLVFMLGLVAIATGATVLRTLQNPSTSGPATEQPSTSSTAMPTMSVVVAPSSSPTMSFVELLKPWIVRNEADLALLNDGISPQWQALDWLSTDSIALAENHSPRVILQRYVLAVLYYATSGDVWAMQLGSYLQPTSVCEWNNGNPFESDNNGALGVYCIKQSSVQEIRILKLGLFGTVPWELSLLESLVFLDLSGNSLKGTLPPELGDLGALTSLYMYESGLTGTLPTTFGRLKSLTTFWAFGNDLTGPLPTEMGQMVSLQTAFFANNGFNGTIPTEIGQLEALQHLAVDSNNLSGTLPPVLGALQALQELYIQENGLTGTLPTTFGRLKSLTTFWAFGNDLTGSLPTEIGLMESLQTAFLANNAFNGTLPTEIGQWGALQRLAVDSNNLSGILPTELGLLPSLQEAWFQDNQLVGTVPTEFARLSNLSKLSLEKNNLTGSVDDVLCPPQRQWAYLKADCAPDGPNDTALEIQCSCCNYCCASDGITC